ncbi:MAG: helix-turn-helix domain protein [Thermoleophilia bacterium]|nr:helix-turn-helix domain protein [Thermoleophilia bacterium]
MASGARKGKARREPDLVKFGENLRRLRTEKGYSQESLALEVGLHRTYVGACERGEYGVSLPNLIRFARTLGVSPAELLAGIR